MMIVTDAPDLDAEQEFHAAAMSPARARARANRQWAIGRVASDDSRGFLAVCSGVPSPDLPLRPSPDPHVSSK